MKRVIGIGQQVFAGIRSMALLFLLSGMARSAHANKSSANVMICGGFYYCYQFSATGNSRIYSNITASPGRDIVPKKTNKIRKIFS